MIINNLVAAVTREDTVSYAAALMSHRCNTAAALMQHRCNTAAALMQHRCNCIDAAR